MKRQSIFVHLRAHRSFARVFLRNSHQWKFCFLLNSPSFRITRHFHSCIYTLVLISGNLFSLLYCLAENVYEFTMLLGRVCVFVCVISDIGAHICFLRIKIGYAKKNVWNMNNSVPVLWKGSRICHVRRIRRPGLIEKFTATCILLSVCNIYLLFSCDLKHLASHRHRQFADYLNGFNRHSVFFVYLVWQRFVACVSKILNSRPIQY
jgi:hypothetical protein